MISSPAIQENAAPLLVAGIDGCRAGWVMVVLEIDEHGRNGLRPPSLHIRREAAELLDECRQRGIASVGIDSPIAYAADGKREAEIEGRRRLAHRRSTLFPSPCHAVLDTTSWDEALHVSRAVTGKGLSKQAFNLVARSRQIRLALDPGEQPWCSEVHPELSFAAMAGRPLDSKKTEAGIDQRLQALQRSLAGCTPAIIDDLPPGVGIDDLLDALAAAWTASRLATGRAERLGSGVDPDGFSLCLYI